MERVESPYNQYEKSNAKLIAAAPELLKACQSLVSDFEIDFVLSDGTIVDNPSNLLLVNYKIAKEAIKRAGF